MNEPHSHDVEFVVIDNHAGFCNEDLKGQWNTGTLIDPDSNGTGMLTHVPLQPGDMVRFGRGDASKTGIVMWIVDSSNKFRIQMRFV